jgi:hypothetical protein
MGRLARGTCTVHLISTPDQAGRKGMHHYIRANRAYCPNVYWFYALCPIRIRDTKLPCMYLCTVLSCPLAFWEILQIYRLQNSKRRTNFRLLKETNRKGTPLSVPRAKVVKHPKHFQRVCVLRMYHCDCFFA